MSRQNIDLFLILWSLHGSIRCCETDREADCKILLSLEMQDVERENNSDAPETHGFLTAPNRSRDRV